MAFKMRGFSGFKNIDPSIEDYAKVPNTPRFSNEEDRGTITQTPSRFQKFKQNRTRRQNQLIDIVAPSVPQIKNLINETKRKIKNK